MSPVITIDGPSSVGKGTLCRALAKILRWNSLDSGVIYRTLALMALYNNVAVNHANEKILVEFAERPDMRYIFLGDGLFVTLKRKVINHNIRNEVIGNIASKIAELPQVREALLLYQREFRISPGLVADGRDMGTVVFPDAVVKIFLNASLKARANRRMRQLRENGSNVTLEYLLSKMRMRDYRDHNRKIAPLIPAKNAFILNSSDLSKDEVIAKVLTYIRQTLVFKI